MLWFHKILTISGSNALATAREIQRFTDSHDGHVYIGLANVSRGVLWDEFRHLAPIVSYLPRYLEETLSPGLGELDMI
jgi:hypothetical protein